jgi:arylsulfatase A-like enzyme
MLRLSFPGLRLVSILTAALLLTSCSRSVPEMAGRPNFIVILVDTLRADHLGIYGYARDTSRNVDTFARESLLFTASRSQAACTFPSANSILTSRSPTLFLDQPGGAIGIPAEVPSVAEILRKSGYRTVAISGSPIVRNTPSRTNPKAGFGRGFDAFEEDCLWQPAACLNRLALKHLGKKDDRPFFLYLHYMDPHAPYKPPPTERRHFRFIRKASGKKFIQQGTTTPIEDMLYGGKPDPGVTSDDLQHLTSLYDEEIAYFDRRFGELLAAVREAGLLDDTILVFTSDHGEEFLEHGHICHCRTLFDTAIKTPLIVRVPGVEPRTVTAPVQNLDIVPTLLDYAGVDTAVLPLEGHSLRPLIEGREDREPRPQFAAQGVFRSVSDGQLKLIHNLDNGKFWLYNVAAQPQETRNVLRRQRRSFHRLRETLNTWLARTEGEAGERVSKSQEAEARLKAVGYIR